LLKTRLFLAFSRKSYRPHHKPPMVLRKSPLFSGHFRLFSALKRSSKGAETFGNSRKLGKNSPKIAKLAEFRVFLTFFGLLFSADRL
jgi:hypothetical protein